MTPKTQKVVAITAAGGPEVLQVVEREVPKPAKGEILIRVEAAGINRHDVGQRKNGPNHAKSDVPGLEVAGEIVERGPEADEYSVGQKVCALVDGGGYAQYTIAPASNSLPYPTGFTALEAAAIPEALFTTWYNCFTVANLQPKDRVLIHGGTSGVGTLATQLLTSFGHEVYVTCGDDKKCAFARTLGAKAAINYRTEDFVEVVKRETGGKNVDLIIDMAGGTYASANLDALASGGTVVHLSSGGGSYCPPLAKIMVKSARLTGSRLRPVSIEKKAQMAAEFHAQVWPLLGSKIRPVIDSVFALHEAADAHRAMERNTHIGKIMLRL